MKFTEINWSTSVYNCRSSSNSRLVSAFPDNTDFNMILSNFKYDVPFVLRPTLVRLHPLIQHSDPLKALYRILVSLVLAFASFFFLLALQAPLGVVFYSLLAGFSLLAYEVSRSHTTARHSR